jgi:hypothetical protein
MFKYDGLDYRHWDTWNEGKYNHVFFKENKDGAVGIDILKGETFDSPQNLWVMKIFSPDSKSIICIQEKAGTQYAISTNTDLYRYNLATGITINRTADNLGYDVAPQFSQQETLVIYK